jgi:hypothetical protein
MLKTEVTRAQQKRVKAVTTIASVWRGREGRERYRAIKRNYEYLCFLEDCPEGVDDPYSDFWIDSTIREAREEEEQLPPWW